MSEFHFSRGASGSVAPELPSGGGFSFDNVHRNAFMQQASGGGKNMALPMATKTGTTIVGMTYKDGVVLGADTRATGGSEVADKNCDKIHFLTENIYCCGAGTAADTEKTTELISSQMELLRMNTKTQPRVIAACTMLKRMLFKYQGNVSAALVLGGCDVNGPHVFQIYPHGSTGKLPYTTMGSGSLAAMSVFETEWRDNMNEEEALQLVQKAILAGIFNDLGSGSSCDTCVIRMDGSVSYKKGTVTPNDVAPLRAAINRSSKLTMTKGTTPVLSSSFVPAKVTLADITVTPMET